ncbi:MAG: hypothetical protein A07HR60_00806 [uncultured archaeon A07HR60]|jgi:hypothetical protein|nr:MAG: hypothetical protein A07HR60_00806 [uncultured archaeon A07HR60]
MTARRTRIGIAAGVGVIAATAVRPFVPPTSIEGRVAGLLIAGGLALLTYRTVGMLTTD